MGIKAGAAALALGIAGAAAVASPGAPELKVVRTVMLMRHGVRAPLADPPLPEGSAKLPWPTWAAARAELTPHGFAAVRQLGDYDRALGGIGFDGACPAPDAIRVAADKDQRTFETARAWLEGFAPGCGLVPERVAAKGVNPVFAPIRTGAIAFDPGPAAAAVRQALPAGGLAAIVARRKALLARLDHILCGDPVPAGCGVSARPTSFDPGDARHEPAIRGGLADAATAAQTLLLAYADGQPLESLGWGRARPRDLEDLGVLRADLYRQVYRVPRVGAAFGGTTLRAMADAITAPANAPGLTLFVGHDSNIAAVAGLLGLHWKVPGFAADDPPPSGAIALELLADGKGRRFVRAVFRSPTLEQIRSGSVLNAGAATQVIPIPACAPTPLACPLARFEQIISGKIAP